MIRFYMFMIASILCVTGCFVSKAQPRTVTVEFIADFVFEDDTHWYIVEQGADGIVVWSSDPLWGHNRRFRDLVEFVESMDNLIVRGTTPYVTVDQWGKIIVIDWTYIP